MICPSCSLFLHWYHQSLTEQVYLSMYFISYERDRSVSAWKRPSSWSPVLALMSSRNSADTGVVYCSIGNNFSSEFSQCKVSIHKFCSGITNRLVPISVSNKTSYCKISWSVGAVRLVVWIIALLWNLTGAMTALLLRCLSNFKVIRLF